MNTEESSEYVVKRKSHWEGDVDPVTLRETAITRLVLDPEIVRNEVVEDDTVKVVLRYQRRKSRQHDWEDVEYKNLSELHGEEEVRLTLDSETTRKLYTRLTELYSIPIGVWGLDKRELLVVDADDATVLTGEERDLFETLVERRGEELFAYLRVTQATLFDEQAVIRQHAKRTEALEVFEEAFKERQWSETQWQKFFRENTWIFGHNLAYQFISTLQSEANVGGASYTNRGSSAVDELMFTEGTSRFTVFVDIKRPNTELVQARQYRNRAYAVSDDVAGGVAQLQNYARTWTLEGAGQEDNLEVLIEERIETYQPKGILVVGDLNDIGGRQQRASFELFRRHLWNPEIITYDELLERARFTVELENEAAAE